QIGLNISNTLRFAMLGIRLISNKHVRDQLFARAAIWLTGKLSWRSHRPRVAPLAKQWESFSSFGIDRLRMKKSGKLVACVGRNSCFGTDTWRVAQCGAQIAV